MLSTTSTGSTSAENTHYLFFWSFIQFFRWTPRETSSATSVLYNSPIPPANCEILSLDLKALPAAIFTNSKHLYKETWQSIPGKNSRLELMKTSRLGKKILDSGKNARLEKKIHDSTKNSRLEKKILDSRKKFSTVE